jgi:hypothetical protein
MGEKISDSRARDILSLLVRANTSANPRERLSDEEVLARSSCFICFMHILTILNRDPDVPRRRSRNDCDTALLDSLSPIPAC